MNDMLAPADVEAILAEVVRFRDKRLAPAVARHEEALTPDRLDALTAELAEMGLVALAGEASGVGLWEAIDSPLGRALSVDCLKALAEANAGFALHLHQLAQARLLASLVGAETPPAVIALQGRYGLARGALARHLAGIPADAEDREMLRDYYRDDATATWLIHAGYGWQALWAPAWDDSQTLQWRRFDRAALRLDRHPHSHGFDELRSVACAATAAPTFVSTLDASASRRILATLLAVASLGQLAIAAGSVRHALALADDYAASRRQGGRPIAEHPAVQQLTTRPRLTLALADRSLADLARQDIDSATALARIYAARAALQPELCRAANECLQVFGGTGYMRDTGLEKIVRDNNQLRLTHGTPTELQLYLAAWEKTR